MEQKPEKFPREVRKGKIERFNAGWWEDHTTSESSAKLDYRVLQRALKEYGVDLIKDKKVLEVGSGNAVFLNYLRQQGIDAVGVDARPRGSRESPQVLTRIEQLPFADETFDVILSTQVFDSNVYNQDQNLMMQEIYRVLKNGGIYLASAEHVDAKPMQGFSLVSHSSDKYYRSIYKKS